MASALILCAALATATSSAGPTIELVTMGPGDALYTRWGHAAIRVAERDPRRDIAYNYGSIDFSGAFFARMLAGEVDAFVAAVAYHRMAQVYRAEGRTIERRTLNLSPSEARAVADALAAHPIGPDSTYRYHHFDDNCSSQVADVLDHALGGRWQAALQAPAAISLRKLALEPLRDRTFLYVLTDIGLSGVVDRPVTVWDTRFRPDRLAHMIDELPRADGRPWVASSIVEYRGQVDQQAIVRIRRQEPHGPEQDRLLAQGRSEERLERAVLVGRLLRGGLEVVRQHASIDSRDLGERSRRFISPPMHGQKTRTLLHHPGEHEQQHQHVRQGRHTQNPAPAITVPRHEAPRCTRDDQFSNRPRSCQ